MSHHPIIFVRCDLEIRDFCIKISPLIEKISSGMKMSLDFYDFVTNDFKLRIGSNYKRDYETPREDWYPPYDTYTFDLELISLRHGYNEEAAAEQLFKALNTSNLWPSMLTADAQTIYQRFWPKDENDQPIMSEEDQLVPVTTLPAPVRQIFLKSSKSLEEISDDISKLIPQDFSKTWIFDHIENEISNYVYRYNGYSIYISKRNTSSSKFHNSSPLNSLNYTLLVNNYRDKVYELEKAKSIFDILKHAKIWELALVEGESKILATFDPQRV